MTTNNRPGRPLSIPEVLADSHVAALTIAVLLLGAIETIALAIWPPLYRLLGFVGTAVAIRELPYFGLTVGDRLYLLNAVTYAIFAVSDFVAACLLSRWVYGSGPIRSLADCAARMSRR